MVDDPPIVDVHAPIGPLGQVNFEGIDWVIVGGESGPNARPMHPDWAREVRDQCVCVGIPFFFKQWGGPRPKSGGRLLDDEEWNEFPEISQNVKAKNCVDHVMAVE